MRPSAEVGPPTLVRVFSAHGAEGPWREGRIEATMVSSSAGLGDGIRGARFGRGQRLHVSVSWGQGNACAVRYLTDYRGAANGELRAVHEADDDIFVEEPGSHHSMCTEESSRPCVSMPLTLRRPRRIDLPISLRPRHSP